MRRLELHLLNVFAGDAAFGNPTGVVWLEEPLEEEARQGLATRLGYPDTAYVRAEDGGVVVDAHSPAGAALLCVQALLAADAVARAKGVVSGDAPLTVRSGDRTFRTAVTLGDDPATWLGYPRDEVRLREEEPDVAPVLGELPAGAPRARVVEAGRVRVVQELPDASLLELAEPPPSKVRSFCAHHGLDGLVLFAAVAEETLRVRVFTTSLDGQEDAATGGAALALWGARRAAGAAHEEADWTLLQGLGAPRQRGVLQLRALEPGGDLQVGGRIDPVAQGEVPLF